MSKFTKWALPLMIVVAVVYLVATQFKKKASVPEATPETFAKIDPQPAPAKAEPVPTTTPVIAPAPQAAPKVSPAPKRSAQVPNATMVAPAPEAPSTPAEPPVTVVPGPAPELMATVAKPTESNGYDFNFFLGHSTPASGESRSFSEGLVEGSYYWGPNLIGIGQEARKLYEIAEFDGEREFLLGDTRLFYVRELSDKYLSVEAGTTLPVSRESVDNKHITRPSVALHLQVPLFNERVTISYSPSFSYRFNDLATDNNGTPLEKMNFGQQLETRFTLIDQRLYLSLWGKGFYRIYEQYDFSNTSPAPTTSFALGAYVGVQITRNIGVQAGALRGSSMLRNVRYDSSIYDREATRYYAAVEVNF